MSGFPLLVIDQNQLRCEDAIADAIARCQRENLKLLVPDGAGFEFSKGIEVLDTWRRSCEQIQRYADHIIVSPKMTDMMRDELKTGHPVTSLCENHATTVFRGILDTLAKGDQEVLQGMVEGPVQQMMPDSLDAWSDHTTNHQRIIALRDMIQDTLARDDLKRMRANPDFELSMFLSSEYGMRFVFQGVKARGVTDEIALLLSMRPSVSASFEASMLALAVYWLAYGGLDTAQPKRITNDLHDVEYAVLGSICTGLLTNDSRLMKIFTAVKEAQARRHEWFRSRLHSEVPRNSVLNESEEA